MWLWLYTVEVASGLFPGGWGRTPGVALGVAFLFAGGLLCAAWVAQEVVARLNNGPPKRGRTAVGAVRGFLRRVPFLFLAPGFTLLVPAFLLALAFAVALVGRVPLVGPWLLGFWLLTGGLILALVAVGWAIIGLGAVPIQVVACVTEFPQTMDILTRSFSYVRRQPALLLLGWAAVVGASLLGAVVLLVALSLTLGSLRAMAELGTGESLGDTATSVGSAVLCLWSLNTEPGPGSEAPGWMPHVARLVPAFFLTAVFSGSTGLYLLVREAIDGVKVTAASVDAGEKTRAPGIRKENFPTFDAR